MIVFLIYYVGALRLAPYSLVELAASPEPMMGLLPALNLALHSEWLIDAIGRPGLPIKQHWQSACSLLSPVQISAILRSPKPDILLTIGCVSRMKHKIPSHFRDRLIVDEEVWWTGRMGRLGLHLPELIRRTAVVGGRRLVTTQPLGKLLAKSGRNLSTATWSIGWRLIDYACVFECFQQERRFSKLEYLKGAFEPDPQLLHSHLIHLWWMAAQAKLRNTPLSPGILYFCLMMVERLGKERVFDEQSVLIGLVKEAIARMISPSAKWRTPSMMPALSCWWREGGLPIEETAKLLCLITVYWEDSEQLFQLHRQFWSQISSILSLRGLIDLTFSLHLHPQANEQFMIMIGYLAQHIQPQQVVEWSEALPLPILRHMPWLCSLARLENTPHYRTDPLAFIPNMELFEVPELVSAKEIRGMVWRRLGRVFEMFGCRLKDGWFPYPILNGWALQAFWDTLRWALLLRLDLSFFSLHPLFVESVVSNYDVFPSRLDALFRRSMQRNFAQRYNQCAFNELIVEHETVFADLIPNIWEEITAHDTMDVDDDDDLMVGCEVDDTMVVMARSALYRLMCNGDGALRGFAWTQCLSK